MSVPAESGEAFSLTAPTIPVNDRLIAPRSLPDAPWLSGGSDHRSDAVIYRAKAFEPPLAKYIVGDPFVPILAQGVTVVSRHARFRFTAATF
jgi:hypothetical protein